MGWISVNVGNIKIRIDGDNISLIQPDPITGVKNWIVLTTEQLKQINELICQKAQ